MKSSLILFFGLVLFDSCVDRLNIIFSEDYSKDMFVEGLITNQPGPYTVKLSQAIGINDSKPRGIPLYAKKVTLFDNIGNSEVLQDEGEGNYATQANGIRGVVGREYFIRIETFDGKTLESLPDKMEPVGEIDSLYYEFETFQPLDLPTEYGYRIYIDAHNDLSTNNYLRWKFSGTYVVETLPQFKICETNPPPPCDPASDYCPLKCSGYAYVNGVLKLGWAFNPKTNKVEFVQGLGCTCCRCWVTQHEERPQVNDNEISSNGKFTKVTVGYVPVNFYTFFEKYRVEVIQMSLSRAGFDYWRAIQSQKEAIGSLFQPITGKIPGNIFATDKSSAESKGIFYVSATTKKQIYLDRNTHRVDIRTPVDCKGRVGAMGQSCLLGFPGSTSTTEQPEDWN